MEVSMKKPASSKSRSGRFASRCAALFVIGAMTIITLILLSGCLFSGKSTTFVGDSRRIAVLEPNEPAPFQGILITEGRHEYLLDCEEFVKEEVRP